MKNHIREIRLQLGVDIILDMINNEEFPILTKEIVTEKMLNTFKKNGYIKDLKKIKSKWLPSKKYFKNHWRDMQLILRRKNGKFLEYEREQYSFIGKWDIVNGKRYKVIKVRQGSDVRTREESYNEDINDSKRTWQLDLPLAKPLPLLPKK